MLGGYQVYYGNPIDGIAYFKDIVKMVDQSKAANPEQIFNIIETKVVNEFGNFTKERKITPYQWYQYFKERINIPPVEETPVIPHKTLDIPNKFKQLRIFSIRDFKSKAKQHAVPHNQPSGSTGSGLFCSAFIVRYLPEDTSFYQFRENLNIPVFFFMSVIVSFLWGSQSALRKSSKIEKS